MLFDILFVADWKKIGDHRQSLTDRSNERENKTHIDYDYKVKIKYSLLKTVSSTNQGPNMARAMDYNDFIQMELSGLNAEQNRNELKSGE
jgi:hypothetical protein